MTFVGLGSAAIRVVHDKSFHEGFLRPMLRMTTASRRMKLLTHASSLPGILGICFRCWSSSEIRSLRLIDTRCGVVIPSGNFNFGNLAVRTCG